MKGIVIILMIFIFGTGCDMMKSKEKRVVGKISLIDSNDEEGGRYHLIFYKEKEQFNSNVIEDFVADLVGNDSILLVRAISRTNCDGVYYKIYHNKGDSIINILKIDAVNYKTLSGNLPDKRYKFHTDKIKCP